MTTRDDVQAAQEVLEQASKKLNEAIKEVGAPNDFAILLQELLEVSSKVAQFDEMASSAKEEASSEEAQAWKEISLMTLQHCRAQLIDRQQHLIEKLQGLSETGASLCTTPAPQITSTEAKVVQEVKASQVGQPPGLASPPGLDPCSESTVTCNISKSPATKSPPGLLAPPGLSLPSGAAGLTPPPGFQPENQKPQAEKAKKDASLKTKKKAKQNGNLGTAVAVANPESSVESMLNLDAYDSD